MASASESDLYRHRRAGRSATAVVGPAAAAPPPPLKQGGSLSSVAERFTTRLTGFMDKRGGKNPAFKRRFFRVVIGARAQKELAYFAKETDGKPKGSVPLAGSVVLDSVPDAKGDDADMQWALQTTTGSNRRFVFRCASAEEKREWVESMRPLCRGGKARRAGTVHSQMPLADG